jgi:hypothetical protein
VSSDFTIAVGRRVRRSAIEPPYPDLRWQGEAPPDPLKPGSWGVFRQGVSTRVTTIAYSPRRVTVTLRSGASFEDCDLALDVVRRVAAVGNDRVETISGRLRVRQLDEVFDQSWKRGQLESAVRVVIHVAKERGPAEMPGPTRSVVIGPRSIAEIQDGDSATAPERLVALMRRVLWPDPRYESAAKLTATRREDGSSYTLAVLSAERRCVLPSTDRLAVDDPAGVFTIPRSALDELPITATYLDDGNQLVEPVAADDWPALCRRARLYAIPT